MLTSLAMLLDEQDRIQSQDEHRDQQHTALAQGLFQAMDGMKITLIERLMGIASDPELPKPHQQTHRDVAKALLGDPQRVIFAAFAQASEGAVVIRDEGEIERTSDLPPARDIRPSHLAPLRELLVSLEDTAGVDTVDQACRNIEERLALEVQSSGDTTA